MPVTSWLRVGALLAATGCGSGAKIGIPNPESDAFKDKMYFQSLMTMDRSGFVNFLAGCTPTERAHYISRSVEENPPTAIYGLKAAYERFANDPDPAVAAAAKEGIAKAPTAEEYERLKRRP